jgi:hypothetical protein
VSGGADEVDARDWLATAEVLPIADASVAATAARSAAEPWKVGTEQPRVGTSSSPGETSLQKVWRGSRSPLVMMVDTDLLVDCVGAFGYWRHADTQLAERGSGRVRCHLREKWPRVCWREFVPELCDRGGDGCVNDDVGREQVEMSNPNLKMKAGQTRRPLGRGGGI